MSNAFVPALIVVDMQEDFCPPNGSLAVSGGRDIAPGINELLTLNFRLKVATKDFHPHNHISFDIMQQAPNNQAFKSTILIVDPANPSETRVTAIWPVHCVQGTIGANIIPEIDAQAFDQIILKGQDPNIEMYSGFADIFGNKPVGTLELATLLHQNDVTTVFIVGLAGDHCVRATALDAQKEGFLTYLVQDLSRSVDDGEKGWGAAAKQLRAAGVEIVQSTGPELELVRKMGL